mgnify:CR=1 FL=1
MNNINFINDAYTEDGLRLPIIHFESNKKDICVIFIHGMCGTIIDNYFATVWGKILSKNGIGFVYEHNRGHSIENDIAMKDGSFKRCGCLLKIYMLRKSRREFVVIFLTSTSENSKRTSSSALNVGNT